MIIQKSIKIIVSLIIILYISNNCIAAGNQQSKGSEKESSILIINSYTETSLWSNDFIDPIYKEFNSPGNHIDIYTEHMNMLTINNEEDLEVYRTRLFNRYANITPKVIVLLGNSSWALLNEQIEKHWSHVPVILCVEKEKIGPHEVYLKKYVLPADNVTLLKDYKGKLPLTIFHTPFYIRETIHLMKNLMPDMNTLIFLSDRRCISAQCRHDVSQTIKSDFPHIKIKNFIAGDMSNDALVDSLKQTNPITTSVLFFSWFQREIQQGNVILTSNISRLLSNYSQSPIFALHNNAIENNGLIGGCFWNNGNIGKQIVQTIEDKLTKHPSKGVQFFELGTPTPKINYKDLIAANISPELCPSNTEFSMKPPTFWEKYWLTILLISIIMLFFYFYTYWLRKINKERQNSLDLMTSYRSLFENMPILYAKEKLIYDEDGKIIDFCYIDTNPTFRRYITPEQSIIGKKYSEINASDVSKLIELYNATIGNNKELTFQYYHAPTEVYLTVMITCSKQEGYVDVFCVDNTQLVQLQQMLRSANHKLSAALDVSNIVPWKWDLEKGVILCDVNKPVKLSKEKETVNEQQLSVPDYLYFAKIYKKDRERVKTAYQKLSNGEISKIKEEYRVVNTKNGKTCYEWVEVQATVDERDKENKPLSIVGSSLIITQRKVMEEALIQAKEKAEESNRLKSAFLANMSHEIRTPLNAIVGFSGILATTEANEEEERQEYVHIIENNNTLLLQLINDILDLSKIEAGTLEFVYNNIDVNDLFSEIENSALLRRKNEQVEIIYKQEMPDCCISVDKNRLTQVVTNLINNAMKFTETGSIQFGYYLKDTDFLYFYVTDTGCGIPSEKMNSVFGRFVKLNNFAQGTGLGLSICQTIIENMGGQIGVSSQEGVGSTFWFTLPYTAVDRSVILKKEPYIVHQITKGNKLTVLIAEDNDNNYKLFETALKKEYNLIHAWDGEEAINMFKKYNPHIILMDINMPKMNGYEATQKIRELSPSVPVIAVSAFVYAEDEQHILNSGFDGFTPKPINPQNLQEQMVRLLKKQLIFI